MEEIGLFAAKKQLSEAAARLKETGEPVALTRRGFPYANLVIHQSTAVQRRLKAEIFAALAELRRSLPKITSAENRTAVVVGRR